MSGGVDRVVVMERTLLLEGWCWYGVDDEI